MWGNCTDEQKEHWQQKKQAWKNMAMNFVSHLTEGGNGQGQGKGAHKVKRAQLVSNPDTVLECAPGCVVLHPIEVRNATHWGWKHGVFLGMDESTDI
jgi:hypothetical protein